MVELKDRVLGQVLQVHGLREAWEVRVIVDMVKREEALEVHLPFSFQLLE